MRAQFSDEINILIGQRSLAAFGEFGRRPGWDIGLQRVGYLFVLTRSEDSRVRGERGAAEPHWGAEPDLDRRDGAELCPQLRVD